jgi:flagellar biosynthesis protein FlhF
MVGPPGVGKTTCLCKWLTRVTLLEGRSARVWRLDGRTANTAEWLELQGEILGVPVERAWPGTKREAAVGFVDLPGTATQDATALWELGAWVRASGAQAHLVLNGAYDAAQLLRQAAAFRAVMPVSDLMVTHLDEEARWGKLWNLMLGMDCPVRFLATGQNIPGDFVEADVEAMLEQVFARFGGESKVGKAFAKGVGMPQEEGVTP